MAQAQYSSSIPYQLLYESLNFYVDHQVHTTKGLNQVTNDPLKLKKLIDESNSFYEAQIQQAASAILAKDKKIRCIIIAGPSSSGKTTTTHKLAAMLKFMAGVAFKPLELDNYYFDIAIHPTDQHGDRDFEQPECIDIDLINQHLRLLLEGEEVRIPSYDFKTAHRTLNTTPVKLKDNEILLLDSLHGLYPAMTAAIPDDKKFKLYLEPFCQIKDGHGEFMRWTDLRLLRRMSRDRLYRNYNPQSTVGHWHYVRAAEKRHIIPYEATADFVINSSLPYELPFLKSVIYPFLPAIIDDFSQQDGRDDAIMRAKRLYDILTEVDSCTNFDLVPRDSLLREFIGGSSVISQ